MDIEDLSAVEQQNEVDLDALVRDLDAGWDRLPEEALRTCQRHRELVTPRLIEVLQEASRLGKQGQVREGSAHVFAMYLLTEFQANEALPAILEVLSLRDPVLDGLLGDTTTELTRRLLAVLAGDQPDLIESLIPSPHLDNFVRWEAAGAIVQLAGDGRLTRGEALQRLARQLRAAIQAQDTWATTIAVSELGQLNPLEMQDEIKAAFDEGLVDESIINWDCFTDYLLHPDQPGECPELRYRKPSEISDTVEEMRGWYCFSDQARRDRERWETSAADQQPELLDEPLDNVEAGAYYDSEPTGIGLGTIRRESPRIGRNDPCPCGSGKKYKKCCLKNPPS